MYLLRLGRPFLQAYRCSLRTDRCDIHACMHPHTCAVCVRVYTYTPPISVFPDFCEKPVSSDRYRPAAQPHLHPFSVCVSLVSIGKDGALLAQPASPECHPGFQRDSVHSCQPWAL